MKRATTLILELAGGKVAKGILDVFPQKETPKRVTLRCSRVAQILGISVSVASIARILTKLGFEIAERSDDIFTVIIPSFRPDVEREIDLIEEIGRIHGFEHIPTQLPTG